MDVAHCLLQRRKEAVRSSNDDDDDDDEKVMSCFLLLHFEFYFSLPRRRLLSRQMIVDPSIGTHWTEEIASCSDGEQGGSRIASLASPRSRTISFSRIFPPRYFWARILAMEWILTMSADALDERAYQ